jgi:hypothetical protein
MASAFAQGFQMGGSMYDSAERMKLAKEQQEWAREEAEAKRAERQLATDIRTAGQETLGMEGKPVEYLGGTGIDRGPQPAEAQTALRSDIATAPAKMYTAEQAQQDYLRRLRGLDVGKAQQYEKGALELSGLQRGERYAKNQELALGFSNQVIKDVTDAKGDVAAVIEKTFLPLYNADKLPGFKDGGTAKIVPSAVGGDKSIVITYKDGKQETLPADMKTLEELTRYTQDKMMKSSSPENYWKGQEQDIKKGTLAAQQKTADATALNAQTNADELKQKIKADLFGVEARLKGAQANSATANAEKDRAQATVYKNMADLANSNKEAGVAVKEALAKYEALSPEDRKTKGLDILAEGALAAAKKSGDMTRIMDVLKKPDKSQAPEIDPKLKEAAYKEYADAGTDPKALAAIKAKYPGVFGQSALDKALSGKTAPTEAAVEGRPFYNKSNEELLRMTKRAIGTSTSEARDAQAELDARKGESRMKAF